MMDFTTIYGALWVALGIGMALGGVLATITRTPLAIVGAGVVIAIFAVPLVQWIAQ